jgi:hypothetical protein
MPEVLIGLGLSGALDDKVPSKPLDRKAYEEGHAALYAKQQLAPDEFKLYSEYFPKYGQVAGETMANLQRAMGSTMDDVSRASTTSQREGDVQDVENLGPRAIAAFKQANPELAGLLTEMNSQALEGLKQGGSLDPSQVRDVQQYVRQGQSARGMGLGPADDFAEVLGLSQYGAQQQAMRRAYAGEVMGQDYNMANVPFMSVLGRPVTSTPLAAQTAGGTYQGIGQGQFDPFSSYFGDLNNTNYNAKWGDRFQVQNMNAARNAGMVNAGASIASSVMGSAGGAAGGAI